MSQNPRSLSFAAKRAPAAALKTSPSLLWHCRGRAAPWWCHGTSKAVLWHCHEAAMAMPSRQFHSNAIAVPWQCSCRTMAEPWQCHGSALPSCRIGEKPNILQHMLTCDAPTMKIHTRPPPFPQYNVETNDSLVECGGIDNHPFAELWLGRSCISTLYWGKGGGGHTNSIFYYGCLLIRHRYASICGHIQA